MYVHTCFCYELVLHVSKIEISISRVLKNAHATCLVSLLASLTEAGINNNEILVESTMKRGTRDGEMRKPWVWTTELLHLKRGKIAFGDPLNLAQRDVTSRTEQS